MHKIIIDTDPGIDDAQAIAFAIAHPDIELLGLTTVFGNADVSITTNNALLLLDLFARPNIPVAGGEGKPLQQAKFPPADFVHGADGLGNLNLPSSDRKALDESAAEFIVRLANEQPGEITIVAIGPLTNIAKAVMLDPQLPSKIKQLVIMGGTIDEPGNVSPIAEANFINDPHAADIVLSHDWPATLIGLDVTHKVMLTDGNLKELKDKAKKTGQFLWDSSRFYVDFYVNRRGPEEQDLERSCAMHDASAVVYVVAPDAFEVVSGAARVITDGVAIGQVAIDRKGNEYLVSHWDDRPNTHAAMQLDAERVRRVFLDALIEHAPV